MKTELEPKTRTVIILMIMNVITWVAFIALLLEAGAMLVSFVITCFKPEATKNFYNGMDLYTLRQFSFVHYLMSVTCMIAYSGLKAFMCFLVIKCLNKVNLANPFTIGVAGLIEMISFVLFGIWFVAFLNHIDANWVMEQTGIKQPDYDAGNFLFMAGLLFIISQIFRRGVEFQTENELTV